MRIAVAIGLLCLAGCVAAPVQEMSDARQAVRAAQAAGAAERAPQELDAAVNLVGEAEGHLERRAYRPARKAAVEARRMAIRALEVSRAEQGGGTS